MKVKLYTKSSFDAAHKLDLDYESPCCRMHGHRWVVEVWITGDYKPDENGGMLIDFTKIKDIVRQFDHRDITNMIVIKGKRVNPTAENIAYKILESLIDLDENLNYRVRVWESEKSYAEVGGEI